MRKTRREKTLEESVCQAMDGTDTGILPFLPYILQDAWELGASPEAVIAMVRKHVKGYPRPRVLDLGCGKGPVSIRLAQEIGCRCLGIDAIPEFIAFAKAKARELGVARLCRFETGDIRERIKALPRFDVIVLGAIGPVFGNTTDTLKTLSPHLEEKGVIIVDDGYIEDDADFADPRILKKRALLRQIRRAGMILADEVIGGREEIKDADDRIFARLERRCRELMLGHPEKKHLFEGYIRNQIEENNLLENEVVCSLLVIRRG